LGKDSKDIDIALDNMMGQEFANAVHEYQELKNLKSSTIGVIVKKKKIKFRKKIMKNQNIWRLLRLIFSIKKLILSI
jgi:predicted nucleotidyltransferase